MPFGHDVARSLVTAVDLVNTSPAARGREALGTVADLAALLERLQVAGAGPLTEADLAAVRGVREDVRPLFAAPDRVVAVGRLNGLLGQTRLTLQLTEHDGFPLHAHYRAAEATPAARLAADCGLALARVFVEGEQERLRTCAAAGCALVFVDGSRNRSRVYCDSRTCGNRMHVAAHRARRRA